jgi:uracil-DNA glycosylase
MPAPAGVGEAAPADAARRREDLIGFYHQISDCTKCPLAEGRTTVVFGTGDPDADLMFVGEAPGFHEDKQGKPFVGQAGKLLDKLLAEIGMTRRDVFIANVLKCRPPGNRDPQPAEIEACEDHLFRQVELIEPRVICSLGNFATKLLSGSPQGITKVRGTPQLREVGSRTVFLYPIFHPAAALYTPAMLERLREDIKALPSLLAQPLPGSPARLAEVPREPAEAPREPAEVPQEPAEVPREPATATDERSAEPGSVTPGEPRLDADQLGLF